MASKRGGFWRRHRRLKWLAGGTVAGIVALGVAVAVLMHRAEPILREVIVEKLQEHFDARVELASFHISLVNGLWAEGKGLKIWPPSEEWELLFLARPRRKFNSRIPVRCAVALQAGKTNQDLCGRAKGTGCGRSTQGRFSHVASEGGSSGS